MIKLHTQQGDCILEVVTEVPKEAKKLNLTRPLVVLKGEGANTHTISDIDKLDVYEADGTLYLKPFENVAINHEEHGTDILTPNKIYKRIIEREFDYEAMEARQTKD